MNETNYSEFRDRDARKDIYLSPAVLHSGLHSAKSINAFAVALRDNIRRICDVTGHEQKKKKKHVTQRDRRIDIGRKFHT